MTDHVGADVVTFRWAVRLLAHLAGELARAHCAGSPGCRERGEYFSAWFEKKYAAGDMVVEVSSHCTPQGERGHDAFRRIGRYLGTAEWECDEIDEDTGERVRQKSEVIVCADGSLAYWWNCAFSRVPEETLSNLGVNSTLLYGGFRRVPRREGGYDTPEEWCAKRGLSGEWRGDNEGSIVSTRFFYVTGKAAP